MQWPLEDEGGAWSGTLGEHESCRTLQEDEEGLRGPRAGCSWTCHLEGRVYL